MTEKLERQKRYNFFHVQGKLVDDPKKDYNDDNQLIVFFRMKTVFSNTKPELNFILSGPTCDSFATKFRQGDEIAVEGMFINLDGKPYLWVTHHQLVRKNTRPKDVEDRFRKTVELYSLEAIERREANAARTKPRKKQKLEG